MRIYILIMTGVLGAGALTAFALTAVGPALPMSLIAGLGVAILTMRAISR